MTCSPQHRGTRTRGQSQGGTSLFPVPLSVSPVYFTLQSTDSFQKSMSFIHFFFVFFFLFLFFYFNYFLLFFFKLCDKDDDNVKEKTTDVMRKN